MANEMIRIRLKAYDHQLIDSTAEKIVESAAIGAISRIIAVRAQSIPQRAPLYSNPRSRECQAFFRFFS